jgi:ribose-phosphate pyrophosphokinase
MKLLACNSNIPLAQGVADYLGMKLTNASVKRFADQEDIC